MNPRKEICPVYIPPVEPNVPAPSQERDFEIVRLIYENDGILTKDQIMYLANIPDRPFETRMRSLVEHHYVHRFEPWLVRQYNFKPYWLAEQGARYLAGLQGEPSNWRDYCFKKNRKWKNVRLPRLDNLIHDIRITDFRLKVISSCDHNPALRLFEWQKESHFKADPDGVTYFDRKGRKQENRNYIPDGYYIIDALKTKKRYRFLFELDNGVKDGVKMVDEKLLRGAAYVDSALYERRFGSTQGWFVYVCANDTGDSFNRVMLLKDYIQRFLPPTAIPYFFLTTIELTHSVEDVISAPIWWQGGKREQVALIEQ